jgi:NADPH:quinone reductase-like Zn-dependent oxidoreductase
LKALELFEAGLFILPVAQIFLMDQIALAHDISAGGHVKGRLIIKIDQ